MQMASNGWEWTSTRFAPFPGFEPFPFYKNYSEPFFDGEHYVLKGASPRTAACLARASFRNWFRPSYPYIYATFRLVES
jgi:formylglycine-generating enzyme required for sulfatase activity